MYRIGICDDQKEICEQIKQMVHTFETESERSFLVYQFHSAEKVVDFFSSEKKVDLLFLDIEMEDMSGIELGKKIREEWKCEDIQIAYISARDSYAMELFETRPIHFLVKPIDEKQVRKVISKAIELNGEDKYFCFKIGSQRNKIKLAEILYFESMGRKVKIATTKELIEYYDRISSIWERIGQHGFLSIHKSIIVNERHIITYEYDAVTMSSGERLMISQSHRKQVRQFQLEYEDGGWD
jgi:DNA-binding LytR/AlgR family response regulator